MVCPRSYREFLVLVVAAGVNQVRFLSLLEPMGFRQIKATDQDKHVVAMIKDTRPDLVVVTRNLAVFSGVQLLVAVRQAEEANETPFLIIGDKEDLRPGGMIETVKKADWAKLIAVPYSEDEFKKAIEELMSPLIDYKHEEAFARFDAAAEKVEAGELEEAAELYRSGLTLHGEWLEAWLRLGAVLVRLGRRDESAEAYLKALEVDAVSLEAYFGLAEIYEVREEYETAVELLHQALQVVQSIKSGPKNRAKINFYIGRFELKLSRLLEAKAAFQEAVKEDPQNAQLRTAIGDAYVEQGHYAEAEEYYKTALDIEPDLAHVYNRLGMAYRRQRKYGRALELYAKARLRHPEDEHLLFNMARTQFEAGRWAEAEDLLLQALDIAPHFGEAQRFLAWMKEKEPSRQVDSDN